MTARQPLTHPLTGAPWEPLGYRRNGRPIYPILGGAEDPPAGDPPAGDPPAGGAPPPGDGKPDTGAPNPETEKWKALARKHETEAKANRDAAKKLADLEAAAQSDMEKAIAAARKDTETTVRGEVRRDRVLDRIEVLAAKDFADPEDARLRLGGRVDELVTGDGAPDPAAIKAALDQLLKDRPHLAAVQPDGRPRGDADQGNRDDAPQRAKSLGDAINARIAAGKTR